MHFERIADKKRVDFITSVIMHSCEKGAHVLDVGCGNGIISKAIAMMGYKVDAIDVSDKTIEAARLANPHPNVVYRVVPAGELQPLPEQYAAIVCSEVLEHLHEPATLLRVLHKSLQAHGVIVVTVPNGAGPRELLVTKPVQFIEKKNNLLSRCLRIVKRTLGYSGTTAQSSADDLSHVQFFTINKLKQLASHTSFLITTVRAANFIEQVFPFSLAARNSVRLQRADCALADRLPLFLTSGFMTVWKKI